VQQSDMQQPSNFMTPLELHAKLRLDELRFILLPLDLRRSTAESHVSQLCACYWQLGKV